MSGGHFEYCQSRMRNCLERIAEDEEILQRWPRLAQRLDMLAHVLNDIIHDIDWDLSGDSIIEDDKQFELISLKKLQGEE